MRRTLTHALVLSLALGYGGCLSRCGGGDKPEQPAPTVAEATPTPEPVDPAEQLYQELGKRVAEVGLGEPGAPGPERDGLRNDIRAFGEQGITERQPARAAQAGELLMKMGEVRLAEAFLQRAVGLLKPAEAGKEHLYPLAQLKRAGAKPLEAASLYERAIDIEPTTPAEFVELSRLYLAAGRVGPARAAVTRGERKHAGDPGLLAQGAEVLLSEGKLDEAIAGADQALAKAPKLISAQRVKIEALLAQGKLDEAAVLAEALRTGSPESPWGLIWGAAQARLQGKTEIATDMVTEARDLIDACACHYVERRVLAWVEQIPAGDKLAVRSRTEVDTAPPAKQK